MSTKSTSTKSTGTKSTGTKSTGTTSTGTDSAGAGAIRVGTLPVPGATLHYEVRGAGPLLLLICGGVYDAYGYAGLAERLADRYTVVTYDRRGNSRSPLDGPPAPQRIGTHADDAYRILVAVGGPDSDPAYVFGNSSGAIIGLELAARHPERVRVLVGHEPPLFDLLPDRDRWRTMIRDVEVAFAHGGAGAAGQVLAAGLAMRGAEPADERVPGGADAPQGTPGPEMLAAIGRMEKNMEFFIGYEVPPFAAYRPDLAALRGSAVRIVPGVGAESAGEPPNRAGRELAQLLDTTAVVFPGDHGGFGNRVEEFAATLHEVFSGS